MEERVVYGEKNGSFNGQFVTVFFDEADNHIGVNWTNENHAQVYHFILKDGYTFDDIANVIAEEMSICINIDDAHNMLEIFFDNSGLQYLDEYPEYEPEIRTEEEICEYMDEAFDRVWLVRKQNFVCNLLNGTETVHLDILNGMNKAIDEVCKKYGINFQEPVSDWDYGYWSGILAALRWVMGEEKDMLDT
jgi:hypothetical protein